MLISLITKYQVTKKGRLLGKNYFLHYGPFTDPRFLEDVKQTLLHGKSFFGEMLQFKKNGEKYWNLLRITPVRDSTGTITHYVGIKTDITSDAPEGFRD